MRRALVIASVLIGLAACATPTDSPSARPEPTRPPYIYATTGLPAQPGTPRQSVYVVKVDDTTEGRPQQGVRQADLVIQEPVEGGLTRLAAFFQSRSPDSVGPVRSIRASDIGLVEPARATVVTSGGAPQVLEEFEQAGIPLVVEGDAGFIRNPERPAPYNLYADLNTIREEGGDQPLPAKSYLQFGEFDAVPGGQAERVTITFSSSASDTWLLDSESQLWRREEVGEAGFPADTLLVLSVKLVDAGYRDAAGNAVPEVVTSGQGDGMLITGDRITPILWSKSGPSSRFTFTMESGLVISVPPGRTWMALIPKSTGDVSFS